VICYICKHELVLIDGSYFCNNCGIFIVDSFFPIFRKPPLLNGTVFPELKIKCLKGKSSEVNFIDYYYRKLHFGDVKNKYNGFCESLRRLKDNSEKDIEMFFSIIKDVFLNKDFIIVTIPSHNPQKVDTGIKRLAKLLIKQNNSIIDGTDYLVRIKEINQHGQNRTIKDQYNSLKLRNSKLLNGKVILLFDDIYTTGNTINAAEAIIKKGYPKQIEKLTLAKTYYKQ
jgi:predicted amidophosphoribosyltransferase